MNSKLEQSNSMEHQKLVEECSNAVIVFMKTVREFQGNFTPLSEDDKRTYTSYGDVLAKTTIPIGFFSKHTKMGMKKIPGNKIGFYLIEDPSEELSEFEEKLLENFQKEGLNFILEE